MYTINDSTGRRTTSADKLLYGVAALALLGGTTLFSGSANAVPQWCIDIGGPPCTGGPGGGEEPTEGGANNLSFPVILSEGSGGGGFPSDAAWYFATISDPGTQCTAGVLPGTAVPSDIVCYYDGAQVWWLSQRQTSAAIPDGNYWKVFSPSDPTPSTKTVITAIDWGDLLESSPRLNLRRVRTEVTLFKDGTGTTDGDSDYAGYVATNAFPADYDLVACDAEGTHPVVGCFAALQMSDAVPGTEQSINEIQGTDFGTDTATGTPEHITASGMLIDPRTVKALAAANDIDGVPTPVALTGFDATIYSRCARFIIQQITGDPDLVVWDAQNHYWTTGADLPVVDVKAWQDTYTSEINASGTAIYGYNWNAQDYDAGTYRMTFLLDDGLEGVADPSGEHCNVAPNTEFTSASLVANPGEVAVAKIIPALDQRLNGDPHVSSLSYLDVTIKTRGGGGGGAKGPKNK